MSYFRVSTLKFRVKIHFRVLTSYFQSFYILKKITFQSFKLKILSYIHTCCLQLGVRLSNHSTQETIVKTGNIIKQYFTKGFLQNWIQNTLLCNIWKKLDLRHMCRTYVAKIRKYHIKETLSDQPEAKLWTKVTQLTVLGIYNFPHFSDPVGIVPLFALWP